MIALARVCEITHLSIYLPTKWLAESYHRLEKYNWSVRSMGKIVDMISVSLGMLEEDRANITDESFMMDLFDEIKNLIPPFMDYYKHVYEKKYIKLVSPRDRQVISLVILKEGLFSTISELNNQISQVTVSLGSIVATTLLK